MRIHHIGYLVKKMDKAVKAFLDLGYTLVQDVVLDDYRQVTICFMEKDGYKIELVSPSSKESVVFDLMKKMGNTPYHICYETEDMDAQIAALLAEHYVICSEKHEAIAIAGKRVCFLIHPSIGMIELVEV